MGYIYPVAALVFYVPKFFGAKARYKMISGLHRPIKRAESDG